MTEATAVVLFIALIAAIVYEDKLRILFASIWLFGALVAIMLLEYLSGRRRH